MLWRIALRNLGRSKARTALSIIAIAAGVFVVLLTKGFIDGIMDQMWDSTVRFASGHIRVVEEQYPQKEQLLSLNYTVDDRIVADLDAMHDWEAVSPRIRFGALVSRGETTEPAAVLAMDPVREEPLSQMSRFLRGRWMDPGSREVVMGGGFLEELGLDVGESFTLVFNTAFGSMRGVTFEIVGAIESGFVMLDRSSIFMDLAMAQEYLQMPGEVTEITLLASSANAVSGIIPAVEALLPGYAVAVPWYSHSEFVEYMTMWESFYILIYVIILGLSTFVVINTMIMVISERVREIGMLAALGLSPRQLLQLFLMEGTIIGLLGAIVGAIPGGILLFVGARTGMALYDPASIDAQYFLTPRLYPAFSWSVVAYVVALAVIVTLVAVWLPSRRAAKLEPTVALRGNV